jgi:poly(A)-specific ribonuclease
MARTRFREINPHALEIISSLIALQKRGESMNVPPPSGIQPSSPDPSLNGFQKRLVHQLVRAEFPGLVTISRPGFIQIIEFDQAREDAQKAWQMRRVEERISKQVGFRWVVEAMCGGNLSNLEARFFPGNQEGQNHKDEGPSNLKNFKNVRSRLKLKRTVLVGHNLFTDLVNFYRCFFGPLPDLAEDFQTRIHELFPVVIDTKYLATHNCGLINPKSSLEEIESGLRQLKTPKTGTRHTIQTCNPLY